MHWFDGSIAEAVAKSKANNAVFIVFVEGTDDMSRELAATLEEPSVSARLGDKNRFLSIKLSSASPNYAHFTQIYQFVPVPSVFFIGRDGTPLEVVCAGVTADKLSDRVDKILAEHYKTAPANLVSDSPAAPGPSAGSSSQAFIQAESLPQPKSDTAQAQLDTSQAKVDTPQANVDTPQANVDTPQAKVVIAQAKVDIAQAKVDTVQEKMDTAEEKLEQATKPETKSQKTEEEASGPTAAKQARTEVVCDGDVCVRRPVAASSPSVTSGEPSTEQMVTEASPPEAPALDERVERARELIEQKRRVKEAEEKELQRQKEVERRVAGQGVAELKRWQAEQELKQLADERKREKASNDLARQKILEQIAQDRAERRAREHDLAPSVAAPSAPSAPTAHTPSPASGEGSTASHARIQFKMADGSSHVAQFDADSTIAEVHQYIAANLQPLPASFTLWTAFPRRALPSDGTTLRALGLAPSAALLVLAAGGAAPPAPRAAGPAGPAALPDLFTRLIAMVTGLLATLIVEPSQAGWLWISSRLFPPPPPARGASPAAERPSAPGLRHRPASNVHRLREDRSSDDENNTWNGNSTQQM